MVRGSPGVSVKQVSLSWNKRKENIPQHPVKCMQEEEAGNCDCNSHPESPYYISKDVIFLYISKYRPFRDEHPLTADANHSGFPLTAMILYLSPSCGENFPQVLSSY